MILDNRGAKIKNPPIIKKRAVGKEVPVTGTGGAEAESPPIPTVVPLDGEGVREADGEVDGSTVPSPKV